MSRPTLLLGLIGMGFPFRFFMARLTRLPIVGKIVDYLVFRYDDIIILPSDRIVTINKKIEPQGSVALPSQALEHFIRKSKYIWIMDRCICRDFSDCKDYPHDHGCIFLGEAVAKIDPKLGRMVTADDALEHARKCRDAGLIHLMGRDRIDSLWMGARPAGKLMTICHCCPCCCLWKMLPDLSPAISSGVTRMPGVMVEVTDACKGCGKCTQGVCFVNAISVKDGKALIDDECRGCGRCALACKSGAIRVTWESDSIAKSIERIDAALDVT